MKKRADSLAKDYELGKTDSDFYEYIIESLINGNRQQTKDLFNKMHKDNKQDFLINYLDYRVGYHRTVLNLCIIELTQ